MGLPFHAAPGDRFGDCLGRLGLRDCLGRLCGPFLGRAAPACARRGGHSLADQRSQLSPGSASAQP
eukprot:78734-Karenia_brevis.AAC.1